MPGRACGTRADLAELLQGVDRSPDDVEARIHAAQLAVELALRNGEPRTVDVAESLVLDLPEGLPPDRVNQLQHIAATARATRRAIILARRLRLSSPSELVAAATEGPEQLAQDVRRQLHTNRPLARAMLQLARSRHPGSEALRDLERQMGAIDG